MFFLPQIIFIVPKEEAANVINSLSTILSILIVKRIWNDRHTNIASAIY